MQVETYEVPEVDFEGNVESNDEAVALIEKLELDGQRELIHPGRGYRTPYRKMTKEEAVVYGAIFEKKTNIAKYKDEPIPLRVLQVAAHAKSLFKELQVWHKPSADIKDPILVGVNGVEWASDREMFMLARWGDCLVPFAELAQVAAKLLREKAMDDIKAIIETAKTRMGLLESMSDGAFVRGDPKTSVPNVYWG